MCLACAPAPVVAREVLALPGVPSAAGSGLLMASNEMPSGMPWDAMTRVMGSDMICRVRASQGSHLAAPARGKAQERPQCSSAHTLHTHMARHVLLQRVLHRRPLPERRQRPERLLLLAAQRQRGGGGRGRARAVAAAQRRCGPPGLLRPRALAVVLVAGAAVAGLGQGARGGSGAAAPAAGTPRRRQEHAAGAERPARREEGDACVRGGSAG